MMMEMNVVQITVMINKKQSHIDNVDDWVVLIVVQQVWGHYVSSLCQRKQPHQVLWLCGCAVCIVSILIGLLVKSNID